jgi:hypothetical protein
VCVCVCVVCVCVGGGGGEVIAQQRSLGVAVRV